MLQHSCSCEQTAVSAGMHEVMTKCHLSHDVPAENQAFRVVAAMLLPGNFGPYMLGYQSGCQAAGHGCRESAVHCKERTVLHGGHQG